MTDASRQPDTGAQPVLVIGIGVDERGDDAVGRHVARALAERRPDIRVLERRGEAAELLEAWAGADSVVLIDAVALDATAGGVHTFDASSQPLPAYHKHGSTHGFGVAEAIELARALGELPPRIRVVGIVIGNSAIGAGLSSAARAAIAPATEQVLREVNQLLSEHRDHA